MPYDKRSDLPDSVRDNLPAHAQDIYKEAFNSAWEQYVKDEGGRALLSQECLGQVGRGRDQAGSLGFSSSPRSCVMQAGVGDETNQG